MGRFNVKKCDYRLFVEYKLITKEELLDMALLDSITIYREDWKDVNDNSHRSLSSDGLRFSVTRTLGGWDWRKYRGCPLDSVSITEKEIDTLVHTINKLKEKADKFNKEHNIG